MPDRFANTQPSLSSPASAGFPVTPSDTLDLPSTSRAIYVGSAGTLSVRMLSGDSVTFAGVASGTLMPIRVNQVLSTGTSAGSIVALY